MIAATIETTLHKCHRRKARTPNASARAQRLARVVMLPVPDSAAAAPAAEPTWIRPELAGDDLELASWEDAEWC